MILRTNITMCTDIRLMMLGGFDVNKTDDNRLQIQITLRVGA